MKPKEDRQAKADRLRERRLSLLEQKDATEEGAQNLTADLRAVYGLTGLKNTPISPATSPMVVKPSRKPRSMYDMPKGSDR